MNVEQKQLAATLMRWSSSLGASDASRLASQLAELSHALRTVNALVVRLSESSTRRESAEVLSQLHVWLKDETIPRCERVVELAEPIENSLHASLSVEDP